MSLFSTTTGRRLIQSLPKEVKSPIATAMMEQELSAIEKDGFDSRVFLQKLHDSISRLVDLAASHSTSSPIRKPREIHPPQAQQTPKRNKEGVSKVEWATSSETTSKRTQLCPFEENLHRLRETNGATALNNGWSSAAPLICEFGQLTDVLQPSEIQKRTSEISFDKSCKRKVVMSGR